MSTGQNKIQEYESRLRGSGDCLEVFCKHCEVWQPSNGFHRSKDKFKSMCKKCHKDRYGKTSGYKSPSAKAKHEEAKKRREAWLREPQECTICKEIKPRIEYYNKRRKQYLPYCCSTRRTWEQINRDIEEQMKTCFECGLRLPFDEFSGNGNGRDKKKPYCKCCVAAKGTYQSSRSERVEAISDTDDGTLSVKILSSLLRNSFSCDHCGVELTNSYPVTSTNKSIDHDVPLSRGGSHSISNISVLCLGCNSSKGSRTMEEFGRFVKKKGRP